MNYINKVYALKEVWLPPPPKQLLEKGDKVLSFSCWKAESLHLNFSYVLKDC